MVAQRELLIGIAVDVSASMKSSILNQTNKQLSRFNSFRTALEKLAKEAKHTIKQNVENNVTSRTHTFIYIYGLQNTENSQLILDSGVCDFLSLIQIAKTLRNVTSTDIKETQEYKDLQKISRKYGLERILHDPEVLKAMTVSKKMTRIVIRNLEKSPKKRDLLAEYIKGAYVSKDIATTVGIGGAELTNRATIGGAAIGTMIGHSIAMLVGGPIAIIGMALGAIAGASLVGGATAGATAAVAWDANTKKEKAKELIAELTQALDDSEEFEFGLDDTTLPLEKVLDLVNNESKTNNVEQFIYGNTPMKEAFSQINRRFTREENRIQASDRVLFVISDGKPTDGDPSFYAQSLKEKGITIISCYITDKDIINPRLLSDNVDSSWSDGAKLMYQISSPIDLNSEFASFLTQKGWHLTEKSKYFVQLNHSEILEEFIRVVLSPLMIKTEARGK